MDKPLQNLAFILKKCFAFPQKQLSLNSFTSNSMVSCSFPNNKRMKIVKFSLHLLEAQRAVVKLKN